MGFAKIDTRILNSSLWVERGVRDIFLTALIMALPYEVTEPMPQLRIGSLEETGFIVPPGWYGFIGAAAPGLINSALISKKEGMAALRVLGEPDPESRSQEYEGRRLVRVNGGFVVLNFMKYRDRDDTGAERMRRFRQRQRTGQTEDPDAKRVADRCGILETFTRRLVASSLDTYASTNGLSRPEVATKMIEAFENYKDAAKFLRFTVGMRKFFGQGLWCNPKLWPVDQQRLAEWQRLRPGR